MWYSPFLHRKSAVLLVAIVAMFVSHASIAEAQTVITSKAIIDATNAERRYDGENALISDFGLAEIAQARLNDMFSRQYFSHQGPTGQTVTKLAESKDYEYVLIGENIALGSYADTTELLDAWMGSTGHRANILRDDYAAIGVAVGTGMFEGEATLIAVQVFSRPLALCPRPSGELKASILAGQTYIQKVTSLVNAYLRTGVSLPYSISKQISTLMALFNKDIDTKVAQYNKQVKAFEACSRG
jgi:uncharacterized protein YkwD